MRRLVLLVVLAAARTGGAQDRGFLGDLLHDQAAIWTSPLHLGARNLWLLPLGGATAALIAEDASLSRGLSNDPHTIAVSHGIAQAGAPYTVFGISGALFLGGAAFGSPREKSAGLHGLEALIDASVLVEVLKVSFSRERPLDGNHQGDFFKGGSSFPSGHSIDAWTLATVVSGEYPNPAVRVAVFTYATSVAVSRVTSKDHFPSDVLVGSSLGFLVGRYVEKDRHAASKGGAQKHVGLEPERIGGAYGIVLAGDF